LAALLASAWALHFVVKRDTAVGTGFSTARLAVLRRAVEINGLIIIFLLGNSVLYHPRYQPLWQELSQYVLPGPFPRFLAVLAVLLTHAAAQLIEPRKDRATLEVVREVLVFVLAGYAAYAIVFILSPGYVFTGYRFRLTPLTIFFTDVLTALAIYLVYRLGSALALPRAGPGAWRWGAIVVAPVVVYWIGIQYAYLSLMPADQFGILQTLARPPFKGASFVSNSYAAPVAAYTGHWAYIDQELAQAIVERKEGPPRLKTDDRYIWLRDRDTNPDYRKPQYFICMIPQSLTSLVEKYLRERGEGDGYRGCADMGLVKYAMSSTQDAIPRAELVAMDTEGPRKYGYEAWAIVKLSWEPR
jgi:hypothetical protein